VTHEEAAQERYDLEALRRIRAEARKELASLDRAAPALPHTPARVHADYVRPGMYLVSCSQGCDLGTSAVCGSEDEAARRRELHEMIHELRGVVQRLSADGLDSPRLRW
jgi:hypothetical protein